MRIILASKSPRRRELMKLTGLEYIAVDVDADETFDSSLPIADAVADISARKAGAVKGVCDSDVIIAADTAVVLNGKVYGKPSDEREAMEILSALSGRTHKVITGLTVKQGSRSVSCAEITEITFRRLGSEEIAAYIKTGEPLDKAGAYGIQGTAALFVSGICGDYYNVVGLPLCRLCETLKTFGIYVLKNHC